MDKIANIGKALGRATTDTLHEIVTDPVELAGVIEAAATGPQGQAAAIAFVAERLGEKIVHRVGKHWND